MEDHGDNRTAIDSSELPFLVTHWLSNFPESTSNNNSHEAIQRLRQAAADMAAAFSDLGAFGTTNQPQLKRSRQTLASTTSNKANATYNDVKRQWSHVPPRQLEIVAETAASAAALEDHSAAASNLFHVARELRPEVDAGGGRRLGDTNNAGTSSSTIDLTRGSVNDKQSHDSEIKVRSILHALPLLGPSNNRGQTNVANRILPYSGPEILRETKILPISVVSDLESIAKRTSDTMRAFLSTRDSFRATREEVAVLNRAIAHQEVIKRVAQAEREAAGQHFVLAEQKWQEVKNADRVMAQLGIKLAQIVVTRNELQEKLVKTESDARTTFHECKQLATRFRDPFQQHHGQNNLPVSSMVVTGTMLDSSSGRKNHITSFLAARQCGMSRVAVRGWKMGRPIDMADAKETRKAVATARLSHALTFNTHLTFPIYCLSFDKSGRYFCTGADDCLVKVFFLGAGQSKVMRRSFSYGANNRGTIQVCTLRGHAGVICDIDVSSDNAFLATASDDGDVRVWGLKDGSPIAILRGHTGGANMVSWSKLTPYRLVTSGMDGLARIWDIREAALKRYSTHIGQRPEYSQTLTQSEKHTLSNTNNQVESPPGDDDGVDANDQVVLLPPLPAREGDIAVAHPAAPPADPAANIALPPAALIDTANENDNIEINNPAAVANGDNNNNVINPGTFVANNTMDEGVRIVAMLQHGEVVQENNGPGTRARRKKVNVICVARCPLGGHFATGSDDGLCRVWEDEDDNRVAVIDNRANGTVDVVGKARSAPANANIIPSTRKLLTALVGHMGAITDLHYSHAGDRILTASQKDGNARIWSFGKAPRYGTSPDSLRNRFLDAKQIVLRLSKTTSSSSASVPRARSGRRRGNTSASSSASAVTCDVAVWTSDDSKIVTSQSCPLKTNSQDVVPGSQLLLIWDSWSGNCLLAIKQAHEKQCPVIAPHPLEPSIICSAGADGVAKVWDLESGKCLFLHRNKIEGNGPVAQNNEKDKESGYLDGTFDTHGQVLLLTDDNGRITMFDCLRGPTEEQKEDSPAWMKEQYFANDYYELFYNSNGYCVERGSEQPPHLAPRSARCNHLGAAWSDDVSETYRMMKGPSPLSESLAMFQRNMLRSKTQRHLPGGDSNRRAIIMTDFDPDRTVQINGSSEMVNESHTLHKRDPRASAFQAVEQEVETSNRRRTTTTGRSLSNNYRWRDYDDLIREERLTEGGDPDFGDEEEFVPAARQDEEEEDLSDTLMSDTEFYSDSDRRRNNGRRQTRTRRGDNERSQRVDRRTRDREETTRLRNTNRAETVAQQEIQPTRASTRRIMPRTNEPESEEEDDGFIEECLSTNNAPSGLFVHDYTVDGHLFKLMNLTTQVNREWLVRPESLSSYNGRKVYAPQVGDSVVYIPKAHAETIRAFPTLKAPWRNWPSGTRWPIVRCRIVNVRYRFPYKDYFSRRSETRCASVVAILTLEVTGIPEVSADREFPWPKPGFIDRQSRSTAQMFEVSIFESGCPECVIPETLFLWRLKTLEDALRQRANDPGGLKLNAYYVPEGAGEDASTEDYGAEVIEYAGSDEVADEHLNKSGYESLLISWLDDPASPPDVVSPWEVSIPEKAFDTPSPPSLTSIEKQAVSTLLRKIESTTEFREFNRPVDDARYPDYLARIEIPMDISKIKRRLREDYYSSTLSVLADVRLIRTNCIKYNGPDADIGLMASDLYLAFQDGLKSELLIAGVDKDAVAKLDEDPEVVLHSDLPSTPRNAQGPRTRSTAVVDTRSSLELLPPPEGQPAHRAATVTTTVGGRGRISLEQHGMPVLGSSTLNRADESDVRRVAARSTRASTRTRTAGRTALSYDDNSDEEGGVEESEENDDDSEGETEKDLEVRAQAQTPHYFAGTDSQRAGGRHSSRTAEPKKYEEFNSDVDQPDEEENAKLRPQRTGGVSRRGEAQPKDDDSSPIRQSQRSRPSARYKEMDSEDEELEEDTEPSTKAGKTGKRGSSKVQAEKAQVEDSPGRQSRRTRATAKYKDSDSDDSPEEENHLSTPVRGGGRGSSRMKIRAESVVDESASRESRRASTPMRYQDSDSGEDQEKGRRGPTARKKGGARSGRGPTRAKAEPSLEVRSSARPSRRARSSATYNEQESEDDQEVVEKVHAKTSRSGRGSLKRKAEAVAKKEPVSRSSRRTKTTAKYEEQESDYEVEEEEEEEVPAATYKEAESDFDEDDAEEDSEEDFGEDAGENSDVEEDVSNRFKRGGSSRRAALEPPQKRRRTLASRSVSAKWTSIPKRKITEVSIGVLETMRGFDNLELFSVPVTETFPEITQEYKRKIKRPMDFRTIEEDRFPIYQEISELQEDLIQVFSNCVEYNGPKDQYGKYAIGLMEQLDDVFRNVCEDEGIQL